MTPGCPRKLLFGNVVETKVVGDDENSVWGRFRGIASTTVILKWLNLQCTAGIYY